ncbi:ABC transporter substrate-binding protein [Pedobacter sandarakinus]|uniref:ABC transporter substrate-binding protein n=1 Tax=Pedobacter sandarakinus TaxID=353156 RepID=UPI002247A3B5|nr:ABC transporter substrate-binding protein [Pedobacter sandarakinus]MCX2572905.1 ABC transporter substrate-binding protein [Pedobacter sandarakinus]
MNFKKGYWLLVSMIIMLSACSPKTLTPKKPTVPKPIEKEQPAEKKPVKKFSQANISLLVPFQLDEINLKTATKSDIEKFAMPIDFYQGFKLGIDSAAASGLNFKLNVFDTEDDNAHIASLFKNERFKTSNLIVGPVFPDGLKFIANYAKENNVLVVSPLAASNPADFNNPNLISIVNNISLHAKTVASYITRNFNPGNSIVVLINPKKTDDEAFAAPLRETIKQNGKFLVQEYASAFAFETKMQKGKRYAVVVTSADRAFVQPTIDKLFRLKNNPNGAYDINLFGHPNWMKQNYPTDKMQALNTIISSSYKIDYKNAGVVAFIKKYRFNFGFEPGEYAFKGFDVGFYFGKLISEHGEDYRNYLTKMKYKGLHNNFSFVFDDKYGYVNSSLTLLRFRNFALEPVN